MGCGLAAWKWGRQYHDAKTKLKWLLSSSHKVSTSLSLACPRTHNVKINHPKTRIFLLFWSKLQMLCTNISLNRCRVTATQPTLSLLLVLQTQTEVEDFYLAKRTSLLHSTPFHSPTSPVPLFLSLSVCRSDYPSSASMQRSSEPKLPFRA